MDYIKQKKYASTVLNISVLFSPYYQKKIILSIYNSRKTAKKFNEITHIYENWLTIHNINY